MKNLSLKQKIIGGILVFIILIIGIIIYMWWNSSNNENVIDLSKLMEEVVINDENISTQNNNENGENLEVKNNKEEQESNIENGEGEKINESDTSNNSIIVHITGEVKKTGILKLEEGARIADAIEKAGGATKEADLDEINLAYELADGQKIYIPNKKDKHKNEGKVYITSESGNNVIKQEDSSLNSNSGASKNSQNNVNNNNKNSKGGKIKVNINEASQAELETLPGIGPSIAGRIIEYREQNGKFQKIEDLQNVKGIGDSKFANVKEYVTV